MSKVKFRSKLLVSHDTGHDQTEFFTQIAIYKQIEILEKI